MIQSPDRQVSLEVTLGGTIAYVPEDKRLWALIPNGLLPSPARWGKSPDGGVFYARAPHLPLMLVETKYIKHIPDEAVGSVVHKYSGVGPKPSSEVAVIVLVNRVLDFRLEDRPVTLCEDIQYFPRMATISPLHVEVARRFHPVERGNLGNGDVSRDLSAAFKIKGGHLGVAGYFGEVGAPKMLDFGYVISGTNGLEYEGKTTLEKVANKLLWKVPLVDKKASVSIVSAPFAEGITYTYELEAPRGENSIEVEIINAEADIPLLFLQDPTIPKGVQALPDPDFEMLYPLSSFEYVGLPWRVPVPRESGAGGIEKPCTGGLFERFEL
jgi:hypothetical protein